MHACDFTLLAKKNMDAKQRRLHVLREHLLLENDTVQQQMEMNETSATTKQTSYSIKDGELLSNLNTNGCLTLTLNRPKFLHGLSFSIFHLFVFLFFLQT